MLRKALPNPNLKIKWLLLVRYPDQSVSTGSQGVITGAARMYESKSIELSTSPLI
jgi:hypothetical protein